MVGRKRHFFISPNWSYLLHGYGQKHKLYKELRDKTKHLTGCTKKSCLGFQQQKKTGKMYAFSSCQEKNYIKMQTSFLEHYIQSL